MTASPRGVGNFRACCRPWTWEPSLRLPLRNRAPTPRTRRRLGGPLHRRLADGAAPQPALLAAVSRGYVPRGADCRGATEPFAAPVFAGMHGLISETSICVRQNQPGAHLSPRLAAVASRPPGGARSAHHRQDTASRPHRASPGNSRAPAPRAAHTPATPPRPRRPQGAGRLSGSATLPRTAPPPTRVVSAPARAQVPVPA
jgi:hypothetical protein